MIEENKTTEPEILETENKPAAVVVAEKETKEEDKNKVVKKGRRVKTKRQVSFGRAYVQATYNNTMITFTDQNGNVLAWSSAGQCGFKGPKKATPYAASMVARAAAEKVAPYGLKEVNVFVKGVGSGRESAVRAINDNGINVLVIKDVTPIPHNGCRAKKPRRI